MRGGAWTSGPLWVCGGFVAYLFIGWRGVKSDMEASRTKTPGRCDLQGREDRWTRCLEEQLITPIVLGSSSVEGGTAV